TARYLRVTTTYNSANTGVHICDFKVYGTLNVDNNLKSAIPEKILAEIELDQIELNVYPNPFSEQITINVASLGDEMFDLSVIDLTGRIVYTTTDLLCNEANILSLPIKEGMYILRVSIRGRVYTYRIIKY
ncbi:MAG: T9SS type A sorting domain-containing protein, partial [Bacteroidales bacterium]|nr:T9SS type A sorting domain-containing protein [Bacteroidales bacterium]